MVQLDILKPFFQTNDIFERQKNFQNRFRDEWKRDGIIFDLLTAIVLFTPDGGNSLQDRNEIRYFQITWGHSEMTL